MNWKYIVGEVVLIFIGISLAIGFNNWNTASNLESNKQEALAKIREEININLHEQKTSREINQRFVEGYRAYAAYFVDDTNLLISHDRMKELRAQFPGIYVASDSVAEGDLIRYTGEIKASLSLPELTSIAWQTSKSIGVNITLEFDCLYELEKTYNMQMLVNNEMNKVTDRILDDDMQSILRSVYIWMQFDDQLLEDYEHTLEILDNCQ